MSAFFEKMRSLIRDHYRVRCQQAYTQSAMPEGVLSAVVAAMPDVPEKHILGTVGRVVNDKPWMSLEAQMAMAAQMCTPEPPITMLDEANRPRTAEQRKLDDMRLSGYLARESFIPGDDD